VSGLTPKPDIVAIMAVVRYGPFSDSCAAANNANNALAFVSSCETAEAQTAPKSMALACLLEEQSTASGAEYQDEVIDHLGMVFL
jgi:hypothetical protein